MQVPSNVLELQARAAARAREVVERIRPEQLTAPTPCSEWDVRALLNHLIGLNQTFADAAAGAPLPAPDADLAGDDPVHSFASATRAAEAALNAPGALERTYAVPWGETPGGLLAWILFADLVIHAWDLAKATGQSTSLDPALCEEVLKVGRTIMRDEYRKPGGAFGPEVAVPDDAPACDRLAAFYGRQP
jgi:uncharacterized protein (TIGR03086 family)